MFKFNSGRKQESSVWKYFEHDPSSDKSTCTVVDCRTVSKGKNATNMRTHLNSKHKDIAMKLIELDKETKDKKKSVRIESFKNLYKTETGKKICKTQLKLKLKNQYCNNTAHMQVENKCLKIIWPLEGVCFTR